MAVINGYKPEELLDLSVVRQLQDIFSESTGLRAHLTDVDGNSICEYTNPDDLYDEDFCLTTIAGTRIGLSMCKYCEANMARCNMELENASVTYCHAGLVQLAYPVVVDGQPICIFSGGHVRAYPYTEEELWENSMIYGIPQDEFRKAAAKIPIIPPDKLRLAAEQMHAMARAMSDMATSKLKSLENEVALRKADSVKSDFLANMSHEIRTPMNAVIGLSDLALREDISAQARDYLSQIKSSGKALLAIINDILDFSKIESGKMEISEVSYELMPLINDISSIIMTRLSDKNVEFLLSVAPNVPQKLYGDNLRLRQVIINLANNAAKFTNQGHVQLKIESENIGDGMINLKVAVSDTGIGIRKEDMEKLFASFQQVDSKRNRNVEGTGLGLSISKRLVGLMGGTISVSSVYNEGSTFYFTIPQKVIEETPIAQVDHPEEYAGCFISDTADVAKDLVDDSYSLGLQTESHTSERPINEVFAQWKSNNSDKKLFFIIDEKIFEAQKDSIEALSKDNPDINFVLVIGIFSDSRQYEQYSYLQIMRKPVSVFGIASVIKHEEFHLGKNADTEEKVSFIAPDANILIVDDNAVNLTVAKGLLEPLSMHVDTATSGKECISMLDSVKYDIIFMDHMMPEMDGIETTRVIRRMFPDYENTPIIALSANAVQGARELFLSEQMNDFISKPIELNVLIRKVKEWLPQDKIKANDGSVINTSGNGGNSESGNGKNSNSDEEKIPDLNEIVIADLDIKAAKKLVGTDKLYWKVLKEYYRSIGSKIEAIRKSYDAMDWPSYTIEVHALKSSSRQIGAMELGALAEEMEFAGKERNISWIRQRTDEMLDKYNGYIAVLDPYFKEKEVDTSNFAEATPGQLADIFKQFRTAIDDLDMDGMTECCNKLSGFRYDEAGAELLGKLKEASDNIDVDTCTEILDMWEQVI